MATKGSGPELWWRFESNTNKEIQTQGRSTYYIVSCYLLQDKQQQRMAMATRKARARVRTVRIRGRGDSGSSSTWCLCYWFCLYLHHRDLWHRCCSGCGGADKGRLQAWVLACCWYEVGLADSAPESISIYIDYSVVFLLPAPHSHTFSEAERQASLSQPDQLFSKFYVC